MSSWQQAVVVACKREASAQRLTLVYGLGTAEETFEHDFYLRKGKADVLWRFARPARQLADDWDAILARDPGYMGGYGGGRAAAAPAAAADGAAAKKRKAAPAAPYTKEVVAQAISASLASRKVDDLKAMLLSIEERRQSVVGQLALERVREMLQGMSAPPLIHLSVISRAPAPTCPPVFGVCCLLPLCVDQVSGTCGHLRGVLLPGSTCFCDRQPFDRPCAQC